MCLKGVLRFFFSLIYFLNKSKIDSSNIILGFTSSKYSLVKDKREHFTFWLNKQKDYMTSFTLYIYLI